MTKKNNENIFIGLTLAKTLGSIIESDGKKLKVEDMNFDSENSIFIINFKDFETQEIIEVKIKKI